MHCYLAGIYIYLLYTSYNVPVVTCNNVPAKSSAQLGCVFVCVCVWGGGGDFCVDCYTYNTEVTML